MTILSKLLAPNARPEPAQKTGSKMTAARPLPSAYKSISAVVGTLQQYQDVPQRLQRQWITAFLAIMVLVSIIAGLYLNVASRTAIAGREIQHLQRLITENQHTNADLQTQIATLLSSNSLEERAAAAQFAPVPATDLDYMTVPGYFPQQSISLVSPIVESEGILMSPDYSESLFSWVTRQLEVASLPLAQDR